MLLYVGNFSDMHHAALCGEFLVHACAIYLFIWRFPLTCPMLGGENGGGGHMGFKLFVLLGMSACPLVVLACESLHVCTCVYLAL